MRIISGKFKGRTIPVSKGIKARPTTDFAKTALFNILEHKIDFSELNVLDLYCGTGSIGFEFLSRGAKHITAVDMHYSSATFCNDFAKTLGCEKQYIAYKNDCIRAIKQVKKQFNLIFCDPPFTYLEYQKLLTTILESDILAENGLLIIEHGRKTSFENEPFYLETRKYGSVEFSFFSKS